MHKKVVKSFCDASRMCILVEIAMLKASIKRTQASKPNLSCLPADNGAVQTHYFAKLLVLIVKLDFMSRSMSGNWKFMRFCVTLFYEVFLRDTTSKAEFWCEYDNTLSYHVLNFDFKCILKSWRPCQLELTKVGIYLLNAEQWPKFLERSHELWKLYWQPIIYVQFIKVSGGDDGQCSRVSHLPFFPTRKCLFSHLTYHLNNVSTEPVSVLTAISVHVENVIL